MNAWTGLVGTLILGQPAAESAAGAAAASAVQVQSVWDFVVKGGPMMIPIAIGSLVALAVVVERLVSPRDNQQALEYCRRNDSPVARVFAAGIKRLGEPVDLLEKHIQEAGRREVFKLRKYLRLLAVIASISPLMGLLGTIFGMIDAFQTVAISGEALGKTELLAKGIYEAMITTAAGLLVTIPVLIAYHWISGRIDSRVSEMDQMTVEFVEEFGRTEQPDAGPAIRFETSDGAAEAAQPAPAASTA